MSSGKEHQFVAAAVVGACCWAQEADRQEKTIKPIAGALVAGVLTKLPDVLEPATHPNHRQFFHSVAFAGLLAAATHKVYRWQPETPGEEVTRFVMLVGAAAYFIHLVLDAATPKSLPILGKL